MISVATFKWPIAILLFNRPHYASKVLASLASQTMQIDQSRLMIFIDGFQGSKKSASTKFNRTSAVYALAKAAFPDALFIKPESNVGIAGAYQAMENWAFGQRNSDWAVFFEEDFVVSEDYLEGLASMIDKYSTMDEIAGLSLTGDSRHHSLDEKLVPMDHMWAFALRKSHHIERQALLEPYLEIVSRGYYHERPSLEIARTYAKYGIFLQGSSQDWVKRAIADHTGRYFLTTYPGFGQYIGEVGAHMESQRFKELFSGADIYNGSSVEFVNDLKTDALAEISNAQKEMRAHQAVEFFWGGLIGIKQSANSVGPIRRIWRRWLRVWRAL